MGVNLHAQTLPPRAVRYVVDDYGITLPEPDKAPRHEKFR